MRFLFDQNISHRILSILPDLFDGSTSVKGEDLINAPDIEIWEFAKKLDYTIVTQDSDFNDLNSLHGFPPKIIWIRTGNLRTQQIVDLLLKHSQEIEGFLENSKYGCFEIVSIKK
jgi:predicted nuclease of predicted toxin-antitoxin system